VNETTASSGVDYSGFATPSYDGDQCAMCGVLADQHLSTQYDDSVYLCKSCMANWRKCLKTSKKKR